MSGDELDTAGGKDVIEPISDLRWIVAWQPTRASRFEFATWDGSRVIVLGDPVTAATRPWYGGVNVTLSRGWLNNCYFTDDPRFA